ncbi:unnamed protein product [Brachionus calyciflorus]|uniref:Uncharacterized protein n=1 Tax=Brachionus calyciflorus TaxID=104777 RepID=A0A813UYM2_9BILA|nr:unnamed protein product [Brachionus calyciflorus]
MLSLDGLTCSLSGYWCRGVEFGVMMRIGSIGGLGVWVVDCLGEGEFAGLVSSSELVSYWLVSVVGVSS